MTIILAVLVGLLLLALSILSHFYAKKSRAHGWLKEDLKLELEAKAKLEKEIGVLRTSNRDSLKVWKAERQNLWAKARDAERHAQELQAFHLYNEKDLQHELAGAHALIELLLLSTPKGEILTQKYEVQRLFRDVALAAPKVNTPGSTKHPDAPFVF